VVRAWDGEGRGLEGGEAPKCGLAPERHVHAEAWLFIAAPLAPLTACFSVSGDWWSTPCVWPGAVSELAGVSVSSAGVRGGGSQQRGGAFYKSGGMAEQASPAGTWSLQVN